MGYSRGGMWGYTQKPTSDKLIFIIIKAWIVCIKMHEHMTSDKIQYQRVLFLFSSSIGSASMSTLRLLSKYNKLTKIVLLFKGIKNKISSRRQI
jgi:hypothetical protein